MSELLVPFVAAAVGADAAVTASAYQEASRGAIDPDTFWRRVRLDPVVEDAYLSRHSLVAGVRDFLEAARRADVAVWCLSNDVERRSRKLRAAFGIEEYLAGAVISSAAGARKPDRAIYQRLLDESGFSPQALLFVDDRAANVEAARAMDIASVQFDSADGYRELKRMLV